MVKGAMVKGKLKGGGTLRSKSFEAAGSSTTSQRGYGNHGDGASGPQETNSREILFNAGGRLVEALRRCEDLSVGLVEVHDRSQGDVHGSLEHLQDTVDHIRDSLLPRLTHAVSLQRMSRRLKQERALLTFSGAGYLMKGDFKKSDYDAWHRSRGEGMTNRRWFVIEEGSPGTPALLRYFASHEDHVLGKAHKGVFPLDDGSIISIRHSQVRVCKRGALVRKSICNTLL